MREFMHVDDLADACVYLLENVEAEQVYSQGVSQINIGTGEDISIKDLAHLIASVTKYEGVIGFDLDKPDGTLKRVLDSSRLNKFGWKHKISLSDGLDSTYKWYKDNINEVRSV
jgi:GDP-L-fucose synthase